MNKKSQLLIVLTLLLVGCATSRYRLGFYQLAEDQKGQYYSPAPVRADALARSAEEQFLKFLIGSDFELMKKTLAPKLNALMTDAALASVRSATKKYGWTGQYQLLESSRGSNMKGPKAALDPYGVFDYVGAAYTLAGKSDVVINVYTTRIDSEIKVCGFAFDVRDPATQKVQRDLVFLAPQSVDKAKLNILNGSGR